MRFIRYIIPLILAVLVLDGCRSSSALRKQKEQQEENVMLVRTFLEEPPVQELTASISFDLNGTKVSGQLRMRRGRSIQISASMLGLVEVARVEFLPDMVVVMDRFHNLYSVCHYADIPYRNELGLNFEVVQALLWNRIFSPESADIADACSRLMVERTDAQGNVRIKDLVCGYQFITDGKERLDAVTKSGSGYSFRIDYSDFTAVSGSWNYPLKLGVEVNLSGSTTYISAKLSSVSAEKKNWADRSSVSRRMRQVTLDELLDNLDI